MNITGETLQDLEFVALKQVASLDSRTVRELIDQRVISNHRDLSINRVTELKDNELICLKSREKLNAVKRYEADIRRRTDEYVSIIEKNNLSVISELDSHYPWAWKQLKGMPTVFFAKGNTNLLESCYQNGSVAMVGSRRPSKYGLYATEDFAGKLSGKDVVIVSGMAMGVDAAAHRTAIKAGGKSIAILPCGAESIYPSQNSDIYRILSEEGLVISELPPGTNVIKKYFPARNRLISGLSDVVLIMEAGEFSGTLHTASFAASQGKDVFVLPNSIYSDTSLGGLYLLRDGAEVLIDVDTVVERVARNLFYRLGENRAYNDIKTLWERFESNPENLTEEDLKQLILDVLSAKPVSVDTILGRIKIPVSQLLSLMTELEMENLICCERGNYSLTFM